VGIVDLAADADPGKSTTGSLLDNLLRPMATTAQGIPQVCCEIFILFIIPRVCQQQIGGKEKQKNYTPIVMSLYKAKTSIFQQIATLGRCSK